MPAQLLRHLADRVREIPPFYVMELLARAQTLQAQGRDIIHMEVGEPDFPTPPAVIEAARQFLETAQVRYTPATGLPELRAAISDFYASRFGAAVPAERIIVTPGASGALLLAIATLTDPGDEWLLADPGYPCNRQFVQAFNGIARSLPVDAATAYQPSVVQIDQAWQARTRGVLVATPSNPAGTLMPGATLLEIADLAASKGGSVIVDEIYQGLVYTQTPNTVLTSRQDVFVVNSFSKYFGMTGWRLGWLVVPEGYARYVERLAQHLFIAPPTPAQFAALGAFSTQNLATLEERREVFGIRRKALLNGLRAVGFKVDAEPEGAFYVYARVSHLCQDSTELAYRLLDTAGIATTPGVDFGSHRASEHLRIAYTTELSRIEEALERLRSAL